MRMWSRNTTLALAVLCLAAPAAMGIAPREAGAQSFPYTLTVINRCNRLIYVARRVPAWNTTTPSQASASSRPVIGSPFS